VKFDYSAPKRDTRAENCHVYEDRIEVSGVMPKKERATFLSGLVLKSTDEAAARGWSLTLVRPIKSEFRCRRKSVTEIDEERGEYDRAARQMSVLDAAQKPLEPVPFDFLFHFEDAAGTHKMLCGDWETSAAYWKLSKDYGEQGALDHLTKSYNKDYPNKGMVFALGTVKARPSQWILLGAIRLDEEKQGNLLL